MAGRELLLLRHAKSSWEEPYASDRDRPLAKRGRKSVVRVARWMADADVRPDTVFSSPARRARQTARRLLKALGQDRDAIRYDERIYAAERWELLELLAEVDAGLGRVMLVGHNPGFEDLVCYLGAGQYVVPENGKVMPTAALAHLRMPDDWSVLAAGSADLVGVVRPRMLPK